LCTSSAPGRSTIRPIPTPSHEANDDRRRESPAFTDDAEARAQGDSPGFRPRLPRQTYPRAHEHQAAVGVGARRTHPRRPRSSPPPL
jgi:hypothetical protein